VYVFNEVADIAMRIIFTGTVQKQPKPAEKAIIKKAIISQINTPINQITPVLVFPLYIHPNPKKPNNPGNISRMSAMLLSFIDRP